MRQVQVFKWEQQVIDGCRQSVKVPDFTANFHQFGQEADGEGQSNPVAIVEASDGQVHSIYLSLVQFIESAATAGDATTLRDYFAARAPVIIGDAMLRCGFCEESIGMFELESRVMIFTALSEMRGEYADAMLAERAA
ncbi:hypothetical protein [Janthinobacterium sp. PC23-8]|uniref:hypothetical protein n=1 Tax=Janthinobacterium sp. PC23-8 TaxID=2012679 RepID=UPI000B962E46|nr:hypothetical protein [Janthinobacterium sp. PC23-8]OYO29183.1 hypothetical protein CD932_18985 [Janthinobacterium sp. PC23-8]